jgi:hypothetical protein
MSSALPEEFFEWLDTAPSTPVGVIVQVGHETRVVPRHVAFAEWRSRHPEQRTPRGLERRRNQLTLLGALLEREERTNNER